MLPSTRNGSGTLRSDIYYTTVFRIVKLVSTKFFEKSFPGFIFELKTPPCPAGSHRGCHMPPLTRQTCDSITCFQAFYTNFSQKIDTISQQR